MVHTLPPWTSRYRMITVFSQIDSGELAARINPVNVFDRRGNVVWYDDFEGALGKYEILTNGAGASVSLSQTEVNTGSSSCRLTTGSSTDDYAGIRRPLAYPVLGKFGMEISVALTTSLKKVEIHNYVYDGTTAKVVGIRLDPVNSKFQYVRSTGTWSNLATGITFSGYTALFHKLKLVGDFENDKYVRFIYDNTTYDMSTKSLYSGASAIAPMMLVSIIAYTAVDNNRTVYVDDFIMTQNEV